MSTPAVHAMAVEIRAAIFGRQSHACGEFACLVDTLTAYLSELREHEGGPDGRLASLEFDVAEELAELFLAIASAS